MLYLIGCNSEADIWNNFVKKLHSTVDFRQLFQEKGLDDFIILKTCHRWECYWFTQDRSKVTLVRSVIQNELEVTCDVIESEFYLQNGPAAINHLFRVSAGLDSLILGEHEILGQIKETLTEGIKLKTTNEFTRGIFQAAIHIGKKVRNQTAISQGKISYASLIIDLVEKNNWLNPLPQALIVGTGNLAKSIAHLLDKKGIRPYFVAGRNERKAVELAIQYESNWSPAVSIRQAIKDFSLIIGASKSEQYLLTSENFSDGEKRKLIIDLSVPGVIDPKVNQLKHIQYIGLDIVECMIQDNLEQRQAEIEMAEYLVAQAVEEIIVALRQRQQNDDLSELKEQAFTQSQNGLLLILSQVDDDNLRKKIAKHWNEQFSKMVYIMISAEKNERMHRAPTIDNHYFPIILSLKDRKIAVIGGGAVAFRKVQRLLEANADITVISPRLDPEMMELMNEKRIQWRETRFSENQLTGFDLVITATRDHFVNLEVIKEAHQRGILVNSVEEASDSDFLFPAILRRGDLLIAISTSGKNPALARKIRQELEQLFGQEYAALLGEKAFGTP